MENEFDKQAQGIMRALAAPEYREHWPLLHSFMQRSRSCRNSPLGLFELQAEMARALRGAQESKRRLTRQISDGEVRNDASRREVKRLVATADRLGYVIREIADGIAWRSLRYDRPVIQALAMKPGHAHVDMKKTPGELADVAACAESGNVAILNDLTNILRHGDVTVIRPDGDVRLREVKSGKGSRKSGRATRQGRRLRQVTAFCNDGVGWTEEGLSAFFEHNTEVHTHVGTVNEVLDEARSEGIASAQLNGCVAIEAWHMENFLKSGRKPGNQNPFANSPAADYTISLRDFDKFRTKPAPYSIFPFDDQHCLDLMTGAMWLITYFDHTPLVSLFKRRGITALWPDLATFEEYSQLPIAQKMQRRDELAPRLMTEGAGPVMLAPPAQLGRIAFEFLQPQSYVDAVAEMFDRTKNVKPRIAFFSAFPNEAEIWD